MKLLWFQSCQKEVENKERKKVDLEPELKKLFWLHNTATEYPEIYRTAQ